MIKYCNEYPGGVSVGPRRPIVHRGHNLALPAVLPIDQIDLRAPKNIYGRISKKRGKKLTRKTG